MNCLQAEEHFSAHFEDTLNYQVLRDFEGASLRMRSMST